MEWMREAYHLTRKDGAVGVDGQTAKDYELNLEENLQSLLRRFKDGSYCASPARRVYIPKGNGERRPLGIPTFERKILERAVLMLLEPIYEQDFQPVSFGFRPNRSAHQALKALHDSITWEWGRYLIDVDIRKYFDTINFQHLRAFLDLRIKDGVIRRTIDKWLKAGIVEDGRVTRSSIGCPQGSCISPLLSNIYLHYVLDKWFKDDIKPRMKGYCSLMRFADDLVMVFEHEEDCCRVYQVLEKRFVKYGLALHPDKTRIIDFCPKTDKRYKHERQAFNFLGFTHIWVRSRKGNMIVAQRTAKSRIARTIQRITMYCKSDRHRPIAEQHVKLNRMLMGHYAYFGITGNIGNLRRVKYNVENAWRKWLSRRSNESNIKLGEFYHLLKRFPLLEPKIYHSYATLSEPCNVKNRMR